MMHDRHPGVPTLGALMIVHGGILTLLSCSLVCTSPLQVMEGEDGAVIVFGVAWAMVMSIVGPLTFLSGWMLRSYRGRWFAVIMATLQLFTSGCFCGVLSLVIWGWAMLLLVFDRRAVASFYAPDF